MTAKYTVGKLLFIY